MEERDKLTQIGVEPLTKDNYEHWFNWVKNYLIAQDLWQVVDKENDKSVRPDDGMDQKEEYLTWQGRMLLLCTLFVFLVALMLYLYSKKLFA